MIDFNDLMQWDRFVTPSIIRVLYWLGAGLVVLSGLSLLFSALATMAINAFAGLFALVAALVYILAGIIFVRVVCELVMVVFRINDNLAAIRDRGKM